MPRPTRTTNAWHAVKGPPHKEVVDICERLANKTERDRIAQFRRAFLDEGKYKGAIGERARFNMLRSVVETQMARIAKNLPAPQVLSIGGTYEIAQRAKLLTRYLAGDWDRLHADEMREEAFFNACIFGTGVVKQSICHGRVEWHEVYRENLFVLPREEQAGHRHIRSLFEFAPVDRGVAIAKWPKMKKEIEACDIADSKWMSTDSPEEDQDDVVAVFEAWRLPSGPDAPGRHVIVCANATLVDEEYTEDRFPHSFIHYSRDPRRFFGRGIPDRLEGLQTEQNDLSRTISDGARLLSGTKFILYGGSDIDGDIITNDIGEFIKVSGPNPPYLLQVPPAAIGTMEYAERQRRSMLEAEGLSEMSANSSKPVALNSGKALLTHHDIESERHAMLAKAFERFTVDLAEVHIMMLEQLDEGDDEYEETEAEETAEHEAEEKAERDSRSVYAMDDDGILEEIKFEDAKFSKQHAVVRVFPVSALASTPAGKLEQLTDLLNSGAITGPEFRELYDFPDLDRSHDLEHAARNLSRKLVAKAIKGEEVASTRIADLPFLIKYGWQQYALLQLQHDASDDDLVQLRRLIGHADGLLKQEAMAAAAEAMRGQQLPLAQPAPVPPMGPDAATPMPEAPAQPLPVGGYVQ